MSDLNRLIELYSLDKDKEVLNQIISHYQRINCKCELITLINDPEDRCFVFFTFLENKLEYHFLNAARTYNEYSDTCEGFPSNPAYSTQDHSWVITFSIKNYFPHEGTLISLITHKIIDKHYELNSKNIKDLIDTAVEILPTCNYNYIPIKEEETPLFLDLIEWVKNHTPFCSDDETIHYDDDQQQICLLDAHYYNRSNLWDLAVKYLSNYEIFQVLYKFSNLKKVIDIKKVTKI